MALNISLPRFASGPLSGMALAAAAFALMTSVDTIFKIMAEDHPAYQLLLVNAGFAVVPIIGWALLTGGLERLHTEKPFLHLIRGSLGVLSSFFAIFAYSRLPLASFYAIVFSGPLLVTMLSVFWLGEKIDAKNWLAIITGFLGILLVIHPNADSAHGSTAMLGRLFAVASISCYSFSVVMLRRMRTGESNLAFSLYGYIAGTIIAGSLFLVLGGPELSRSDFMHLALAGLLSGVGSICLMTAYHRSPVAVVAPFQYTQIFWGALVGWLLWHEFPGKRLFIGAAIIAASGLFLIYREMQQSYDGQKVAKYR